MAFYKITHPATGKVVNLHISSQTGPVPNGTRLSLYSWQNNNDQKWQLESVGNPVILRLARDTSKVINRSSSNNAHVWTYDGATETQHDSFIDTETTNGNTRIKLVYHGLYLTKNANDNFLSWAGKIESNRQYFKLEEVAGGSSKPIEYVYPTSSRTVSQGFSSGHKALDITQYEGAPIYAVYDGIVSFIQNSSGSWKPDDPNPPYSEGSMETMGNLIVINSYNPDIAIISGNFMRTIYMHLRDNPTLVPGTIVHPGDVIGYMGTTGRSSGPHLHFGIAVGNNDYLAPGYKGWTSTKVMPLIDPHIYFPEYN